MSEVEVETEVTSVEPKQNNLKNSYKTLWGYFDQEIKWFNAIMISILHIWLIYGIIVELKWEIWPLVIYNYLFITVFSGFGITAGAHRYYTHKCYKAKLPLRIYLMLAYTSSSQNTLFDWVRDHRVHHKYSETDADPHNSRRGFFFAHCGWLMLKKHPEVLSKGKALDYSDILEDPVIQFHQKFFYPLVIFFGHILPIALPMSMSNFSFVDILNTHIVRWVLLLNGTWSVNSAAHLWGTRPYDKNIFPVETKVVSFFTLGEGWHNYHHTFPWDYKASEWSYYFNSTTLLIDFFAKLGWAYDLKQPTKELVEKIVRKSGDGSHFKWGHDVVSETEGMEMLCRKSD